MMSPRHVGLLGSVGTDSGAQTRRNRTPTVRRAAPPACASTPASSDSSHEQGSVALWVPGSGEADGSVARASGLSGRRRSGHTASRASTGGAHAAAIRDARLPGPLASGAGQSQQGPAAVRGEPGRLVQERVRPEIHACPINRDGRPRSGYRRRRRSRRPPGPQPGRPARPRGRRPCDTREPLARSGVDRACACAEGAAPRGAPHGPCRTANDTSRTRRTGRGSARAGDQRARPGRREWRPSRRPGMYRATARM
jgi:hypothetical protein